MDLPCGRAALFLGGAINAGLGYSDNACHHHGFCALDWVSYLCMVPFSCPSVYPFIQQDDALCWWRGHRGTGLPAWVSVFLCSLVLYGCACCSAGYSNSSSRCSTLGDTWLSWHCCSCGCDPQVGTMSKVSFAGNCRLMTNPWPQKTFPR